MMRLWTAAFAASVELISTGTAHADFVLENAKAVSISAAPIQAAPLSANLPMEAPEQTGAPFKLARGFGNAVPMAFAVRQIVPAGVRLRYGAGIDPEALVSWKGDRPWNQALAAAVHPLRLRIVTGTDTVLITR